LFKGRTKFPHPLSGHRRKKEKKESNDLVAGWHPAGMLDRESCSLFAAIQEEKAF
jgi:hypothetical protein